MTITLSPELEKLVRDIVDTGEYQDADALVAQAVRRFVGQEDVERDDIRARIDAAEAEIGRGEYIEYDEDTVHELARDIQERGVKKFVSEHEPTRNR